MHHTVAAEQVAELLQPIALLAIPARVRIDDYAEAGHRVSWGTVRPRANTQYPLPRSAAALRVIALRNRCSAPTARTPPGCRVRGSAEWSRARPPRAAAAGSAASCVRARTRIPLRERG